MKTLPIGSEGKVETGTIVTALAMAASYHWPRKFSDSLLRLAGIPSSPQTPYHARALSTASAVMAARRASKFVIYRCSFNATMYSMKVNSSSGFSGKGNSRGVTHCDIIDCLGNSYHRFLCFVKYAAISCMAWNVHHRQISITLLHFFLLATSLFASTLPKKSIFPKYPSFPFSALSSSSFIPSLST